MILLKIEHNVSVCKNIQKTKIRNYYPVFDNIAWGLTFFTFGRQKPV